MSARLHRRNTPPTPHVHVALTGPQLMTLRKGLVAFRHLSPNIPIDEIDAAIALEDDLTEASVMLDQISSYQPETSQP